MHKQPEVTAQTRQKLLDAFWALYCEKGIQKISAREVAVNAGYNRATFYEYFSDVDDVLHQIEAPLLKAIEDPLTDVPSSFGMTLDRFIRLLAQNAKYYAVLLGENGDPTFVLLLKEAMKPAMRQALSKSAIGETELEYLIEFILSAITGLLAYSFRQQESIPADKLMALIYDLLVNGIMNRISR